MNPHLADNYELYENIKGNEFNFGKCELDEELLAWITKNA